MKSLAVALLLWGGGASAEIKLCENFRPAYDQSVKKQIETGIPFDMVILVYQNEAIKCRRVLSYKYDLWKEVVSLFVDKQNKPPVPFKEAFKLTCENLLCDEKMWNHQQTAIVQVLLNPTWEGQSKQRFRARTSSGTRFYNLNWNEVFQDLPKELEIFKSEGLF